MYFDAHTHLNSDELYPQRQHYLDDFAALGGVGLINIGVNQLRNERAIMIAREVACQQSCVIVKATIGLHPSEVALGYITTQEQVFTLLQSLEQQYYQNKDHIVARGECGLDAHYSGYAQTHELQKMLFDEQCRLALHVDLPVVIHSRDDFWATYEILSRYKELKIYMHCRSYDRVALDALVTTFPNLWIGYGGVLTYPKAQSLRDDAAYLLAHQRFTDGSLQIVTETDAPWLPPQLRRGKMNQPSYIHAVVAQLIALAQDNKELATRFVHAGKLLYRL